MNGVFLSLLLSQMHQEKHARLVGCLVKSTNGLLS